MSSVSNYIELEGLEVPYISDTDATIFVLIKSVHQQLKVVTAHIALHLIQEVP